jgi:N-acetylmuramoyl-L-alanine amidase
LAIKKSTYVFLAFFLFFSINVSNVLAETRTATITVNHLNVREGPGLHYPVIKRVNKGETYGVIEQKNDWLKLRLTDGKTGWVSLQYTSETKTAMETAVSTVDHLRVRTGPGTQYTVAGYLKQGQTVKVLEKKNEWTKIKSSDLSGWVFTTYLSSESSSTKQTAAIVTVDNLNVRAIPSEKGKIIGKLNRGDYVNIIDEQSSWSKVVIDNETVGWVYSTFVSLHSDTLSQPIHSYVKVLHNGTNIRISPSLNALILAKANMGEIYRTLGKEGSWYKIELNSKTRGYVAEWVVSMVKEINNTIKDKTIVLDAGHGGKDRGAAGKNGTLEKTLTLQTAQLLQGKLQKAGANVILTRNTDLFISLPNRVKTAYQYKADVFISIHYDSSHDPTVDGMTIYYYDVVRDYPLAASLYSRLSRIENMNNRGIRFGDFHVLRENSRPSVLLELGYLSNPKEEKLISSSLYQEQVTDAILDSLNEYFQ